MDMQSFQLKTIIILCPRITIQYELPASLRVQNDDAMGSF
jgi:hypothetical protein